MSRCMYPTITAILLFFGVSNAIFCGSAYADPWKYPAFEQEPPGFTSQNPVAKPITYEPLDHAKKAWKICVSHPHMADTYHLSYNYGYISEAKRLGVGVTVVEAGGYGNLPRQISQIENCVAQGAQAVIISAISFTGLDGLVGELNDQGIPVIDLGNGIQSELVKAHSLGSYFEIGKTVGDYLAKQHPKNNSTVNVLWLPGPAGAGWSVSADKGFAEGIKNSSIKILDTKWANSNKPEQLKVIESGLQTFSNIDFIVGVPPAAEAAVEAVREVGRSDIKIVAYYQTPEVAKLVEDGSVYAMATDSAVIQAKVAMDQAVRILDGADYVKHVTPVTVIIDKSNIGNWDRTASLPPEGWKAVFDVPTP